MKLFSEVVKAISSQPIPIDFEVTGVSLDSRLVKPGHIFVAIKGGSTDGHLFIADAVARGASALVCTQPVLLQSTPVIQVVDSREALARLAAAFNGFPALKLTMIGVTGTDGKTTTCNLIYEILRQAKIQVGLVSTVNAKLGDDTIDTGFHVTTPEAPEVQAILRKMVEKGMTHAILETTSHGLEQKRVVGCDFDIGAITNITHEHLDYHNTFAQYQAAKGILFQSLSEHPAKEHDPPRGAILNLDDASYQYLNEITHVDTISYGLSAAADFSARNPIEQDGGINFLMKQKGNLSRTRDIAVHSPLRGLFNVSNILASLATTVGLLGIDPVIALQGIQGLKIIPGRMERIDLGQQFTAIVDFAHTPMALQKALEAARDMVIGQGKEGRVIAVFGSAGLRDKNKRRMMAEISAKYADFTILTAEDPRTEELAVILEEMVSGLRFQGVNEVEDFLRVPDRGEAIRTAVALARPGDVVMCCGKGHEQSMCFGEVEYLWDDRIALKAAIAEVLGIIGPAMPYLPTRG